MPLYLPPGAGRLRRDDNAAIVLQRYKDQREQEFCLVQEVTSFLGDGAEPAKGESFIFSRFPIIPLLLPPLLRLGVELFFFCNEIVIQRAIVLFHEPDDLRPPLLWGTVNHEHLSLQQPLFQKAFLLRVWDVSGLIRAVDISALCCEHQRQWCVALAGLLVDAHNVFDF